MTRAVAHTPENETNLHATCVAFGARGVVLTGKSGSGKSALALGLIALGAVLVADDRTRLSLKDGAVFAHAPERLAGVIEARHVGLLKVPYQPRAAVRLIVDMDIEEPDRLPHNHVSALLGIETPTIYKVSGPHFPAAILLLIQGGRYA